MNGSSSGESFPSRTWRDGGSRRTRSPEGPGDRRAGRDRARRGALRVSPQSFPAPDHSVPDPAPFLDGVIAGDPLPDGAVIWTRVEPPLDGSPVGVMWSVADDSSFASVVAGGVTTAAADGDHCVSVLVDGLGSDRWYWYRFEADGAASRIGKLRTAAGARVVAGSPALRLRELPAAQSELVRGAQGCRCRGRPGLLHAPRRLRLCERHGHDHLGGLPVGVSPLAPRTVAQGLPRSTADGGDVGRRRVLQRHRPPGDPDRLAAARRAWFENMPVLNPGADRAYRRLSWGDLADIPVIDVRQYRDPALPVLDHTTPPGSDAYDPPDRPSAPSSTPGC